MCNLYSLTKGQAAIRDWFRARRDRTGNLPLFPGIFPDQMAPIALTDLQARFLHLIARALRPAWTLRRSAAHRGARRRKAHRSPSRPRQLFEDDELRREHL